MIKFVPEQAVFAIAAHLGKRGFLLTQQQIKISTKPYNSVQRCIHCLPEAICMKQRHQHRAITFSTQLMGSAALRYQAIYLTVSFSLVSDVFSFLPAPSHLKHLPPLWVQVAVHVMRGEDLGSYTQNGIRIRLPIYQALDDCILGSQVLSLQQVDTHNSLAFAYT